jgi:dienelactone hydrolase
MTMTSIHLQRAFVRIALALAMMFVALGNLRAAGTVFDEVVPPGGNFDKAEFRLWIPDAPVLRASVILMPGSNGDGRAQVDDPVWQVFATKHQLALVGVRLTDKPHDQAFIEHYVNVSQGSGQALLDTLDAFARRSRHPELAAAPLLLWGMSAGGEFNYEFVNWKPERVIGFVVNKGGIYYTALASQAARSVPGLLFIGGRDLDSRVQTIAGLFALNRRGGALWALAEEPNAAHVVGRSRDMAIRFYEDVLSLRLPEQRSGPSGPVVLRPLSERAGYLGDGKTRSIWKAGEREMPAYPTSWLPTEGIAETWRALVHDEPFTE